MNQLISGKARALRIQAGLRLIDIAIQADCSPATVRSFEFGAPMRIQTLRRLEDAYRRLCVEDPDEGSFTPPPDAA